MKKNNKGFTLIELLAVIVILSIILGLTAYIAINAIANAKEKSYQVTINNIENNAGNYLTENSDKLFFVSSEDGTTEYQCVTIKDLIDSGYLKNDVVNAQINKDKKVKSDDYVRLERNIASKATNKSEYIISDDVTNCIIATTAKGDIAISVPSGYAKEKEITIIYKLKDISDLSQLNNYNYTYAYDKSYTIMSNEQLIKRIKVTENGKLTTGITSKDGDEIASKEKDISGIDRIGPVITLGNYTKGITQATTTTIGLKVTDEGIGPNYSSFTKDDLLIKIGDYTLSSVSYTLTHRTNENYDLVIDSNGYTGKVTIEIDKDKVFDKLENGNNKIILPPDVTFDTYHKVKIQYHMNGGSLASNHGSAYGTSGDLITKNGSTIIQTLEYGQTIGEINEYGLVDWNSPNYINIERNNYTVKTGQEWCKAPDGTGGCFDQTRTDYSTDDFCNASKNDCTVTLYLNWDIIKYAVTYNGNGGTKNGYEIVDDTKTTAYGEKYHVRSNDDIFYREGYHFVGWNEASDGTGTDWTNRIGTDWTWVYDHDVILYAQWEKNKVKIQYHMNGGSLASEHGSAYGTSGDLITKNGSTIIQTIDYGETISSSGLANWNNKNYINITRDGYEVPGKKEWCPNSDGTGMCFDQADSTYPDSDFCDASDNDCTVTLYLNWVKAGITNYYVRYHGNEATDTGGWADPWTSSPFNANGTYSKIIEKNWYKKTGYKFAGWRTLDGQDYGWTEGYVSSDKKWSWTDGEYGIGDEQPHYLDLYAQWTKAYTVTYNGAGGTYKEKDSWVDPKLIAYGDKYRTYSNDNFFTYYGWEFVGWNEEPDGTGTDWTDWIGKDWTWTYTRNVTLYAQWKYIGNNSSSGGGGCFLAGTKVVTNKGYKDIDKIKIGDLVLAYNEGTGNNEFHRVTNLFAYTPNMLDEELYTLTFDDKTNLQVSSTHRFYIKRDNIALWLPTKELKNGDIVMYSDKQLHRIINIEHKELTENVYNISVENAHNYYVGNQEVLVHNVIGCGTVLCEAMALK